LTEIRYGVIQASPTGVTGMPLVKVPAVLMDRYEKEIRKISERTGDSVFVMPVNVSYEKNIKFVELFVSGELKCDGWKFVAQIRRNRNKNIITSIDKNYDGNLEESWYDDENLMHRCDHCHQNRRRNVIYIIEKIESHGNSERMVIGSTCVKPFFRNMNPEKLAEYFSKFSKIIEEMNNSRNQIRNSRIFVNVRDFFRDEFFSPLTYGVFDQKNFDHYYDRFVRFVTTLPLEKHFENHRMITKTNVENVKKILEDGVVRKNDGKICEIFVRFINLFRMTLLAIETMNKNLVSTISHYMGNRNCSDKFSMIMETLGYSKKKIEEFVFEKNENRSLAEKFLDKYCASGILLEEPLGKEGDIVHIEKALHVRTFYPKNSSKWTKAYEFMTSTKHRVLIFVPILFKKKDDVKSRKIVSTIDNNSNSIFRIDGKIAYIYHGSNSTVSTIISFWEMNIENISNPFEE
jgi:hypothetical protein